MVNPPIPRSTTTADARLRSLPWTALAWPALTAITLLRLGVAAWTPLSPDEAYYWTWSRALAPGYLDHPPMVALWIWLGTALAGDTALGVRLLAPLSAAAGTVFLASAGRTLFPGTGTGLRAAIMLNATLLLAAGAVTMTPDTPLLFFWTAALWALAHIATGGPGRWWLLVGAAAGLGLDSKYTAALLALGIAPWLLTPRMRPALQTPWPWAGAALAATLFAPVISWNAAHAWVSFAKQGGRAADWHPARAAQFLTELVAGQAGLATPLLFILFLAGTAAAARRWRDPRWALLAALTLPGAAVFTQHALGDRVQPNWVAILYPAAALAAAACPWRRWPWAASLGAGLTALLYLQTVAQAPLPRGLDPTARLAGWSTLATAAAAHAQGDTFLATEDYAAASSLAWAAPNLPVLGAEARWHLVNLPRATPSAPGLLLLTTRRHEPPDPTIWQSATPLGTLDRTRHGVVVETYRLYRVVPRHGAVLTSLPTPERPPDAAPHRP